MAAKLILPLLALLLATMHAQGVQLPQVLPCVAYQNAQCVTCPFNYHITQNQCYLNITNCLQYELSASGVEQCKQCDSASFSNGQGGCSATRNNLLTASSSSTLSAESVAANYGDNRFVIISLQMAQKDPFFGICNNFMLNGEYKHFIARSGSQPVVSVAYFSVNGQNQYKILYNGSGGGLMMCIISIIVTSNNIQINSFVPIGVTNIIDHCGVYDLSLNCVQCASGWHLQGSTCFPNIQGCVSYSQNICLYCIGYAILVENRCITCTGMSDLNKVTFFREVSNWITTKSLPIYSQAYLLG